MKTATYTVTTTRDTFTTEAFDDRKVNPATGYVTGAYGTRRRKTGTETIEVTVSVDFEKLTAAHATLMHKILYGAQKATLGEGAIVAAVTRRTANEPAAV